MIGTVMAAAGIASISGVLAQTPPFKSSVDLVIIDAVVLDAKGEPATTLTAGDFVITAGGRPRKVISSEYIRATSPTTRASAGGTGAAPLLVAASNQVPHTGRSFIIVADISNIVAATGHLVLDRVSTFVDGLGTDDLVGLVVLPGGTPRVDLTTDHERVRDAVKTIAGVSHKGATTEMLPGEALGIARGDVHTAEAYFNRIGGNTDDPKPKCREATTGGLLPMSSFSGGKTMGLNVDLSECVRQASIVLDRYRQQSRAVLQSLSALATAMAPLNGPKVLVLVSDGMTIDLQSRDDLRQFARSAEAARVSLYALQPPTMLMEASASGGPTADSRVIDSAAGLDALASTAVAARGTAFGVSGTADAALRQIDRETSGYYILAFERDAADKDDARMTVTVRVNRDGFDVRARSEVTTKIAAPVLPAFSGNTKTTLGQLLRWPVAVGDLPLDADVYVTHRDGASLNGQALIAVEVGATAELSALGFEVTNAIGEPVKDAFDPSPSTIALAGGGRRYFNMLLLGPGRYTLKFAAIDQAKRRGSIERRFDVGGEPIASLRVSDLIFGDATASGFAPVAKIGASVTGLIDVLPATAADVRGVRAFVTLLDAERKRLMRSEVQLRAAANGSRFTATAVLDAARLQPGDYILTFQLLRGTDLIAERSRQFHRR